MRLGADPNKLEIDRYDIITIASVANDVPMLKIAIEGGGNPKAITSRYDGTALIAAAHLGHAEIVRMLIAAKAPLDHVNNLNWTALIESIVLGNGGKNHTDTLRALVEAGANVNIPDGSGSTPLTLAKNRGYNGDGRDPGKSRARIAQPKSTQEWYFDQQQIAVDHQQRADDAEHGRRSATSQPISAMMATEISTIAICSSASA